MTEKDKPEYLNGTWSWDSATRCLVFKKTKEVPTGRLSTPQAAAGVSQEEFRGVQFQDAIDNLAQARFKRYFQRRIKSTDPKVVTVQDIKDVVLFTANVKDLSVEFINFVHTDKMDNLIRSLIIYFEYFFQVWEYMLQRRVEGARKLALPITTDLENIIRDNLTDLRSMVARNYGYVILGLGDAKHFYHMKGGNNVSLSDKDRRLYECTLSVLTRVIWISLLRKNLSLIELELNRIFRTFHFHDAEEQIATLRITPSENRVLQGATHFVEKKLKSKSPMVQELLLASQCYRMLAIGKLHIEPFSPRLTYMEVAYTAPEELLFELNVGAGILGLQRSDFDAVLVPRETVTKKVRLIGFKLPPKQDYMYASNDLDTVFKVCQG